MRMVYKKKARLAQACNAMLRLYALLSLFFFELVDDASFVGVTLAILGRWKANINRFR